jgi:hypothetical protein
MFLCKIFDLASFGLVASLGLMVGGCAAESESAGEASADLTTFPNPSDEGSFEMYPTAHPDRAGHCEVYTTLELTHEGTPSVLVARLYPSVEGGCRIALPPDAREYRLTESNTSCGSKTFTGATADGSRHISITDNRARWCHDNTEPQRIVLNERGGLAGTAPVVLYSYDPES